MTETTSNGTKFSARVQKHLSDLKASVAHTEENLEAASSKAAEALSAKREEARAGLATRRAELDAANARMKERLAAKKAQSDATIAEWKAKGDAKSLEEEAAWAEDYATLVFEVASQAVDEANAAFLDALEARRDAEVAKKNRAPKA